MPRRVRAARTAAVAHRRRPRVTPFLSEDLKPSGTQLLWIGDVYSFVIAGLLVSMGSLGDRIGRKKLLLIGATAFGAVSVLNAYATSPEMMPGASTLGRRAS
ncbi:MFS transporter, partial [Streptomyces massasporeus]